MAADIAIVTADVYEHPSKLDAYHLQVMLEDAYLAEALEQRGVCVDTVSWSNPKYDWVRCGAMVIRSPWDYLEKLQPFERWLRERNEHLRMFNPYQTVQWNLDKRYLMDLRERGVRTVDTFNVRPGDDLSAWLTQRGWDEAILKPSISAGARHTFRLNAGNTAEVQRDFERLVREEAFIIQPFLPSIVDEGERSLMLVAGRFTHAVRKRAKPGDFRVQDDHGGTVEPYEPQDSEIALAESIVAAVDPLPVYARVDLINNLDGQSELIELELIEPELFFRFHRPAAHHLADALVARL